MQLAGCAGMLKNWLGSEGMYLKVHSYMWSLPCLPLLPTYRCLTSMRQCWVMQYRVSSTLAQLQVFDIDETVLSNAVEWVEPEASSSSNSSSSSSRSSSSIQDTGTRGLRMLSGVEVKARAQSKDDRPALEPVRRLFLYLYAHKYSVSWVGLPLCPRVLLSLEGLVVWLKWEDRVAINVHDKSRLKLCNSHSKWGWYILRFQCAFLFRKSTDSSFGKGAALGEVYINFRDCTAYPWSSKKFAWNNLLWKTCDVELYRVTPRCVAGRNWQAATPLGCVIAMWKLAGMRRECLRTVCWQVHAWNEWGCVDRWWTKWGWWTMGW